MTLVRTGGFSTGSNFAHQSICICRVLSKFLHMKILPSESHRLQMQKEGEGLRPSKNLTQVITNIMKRFFVLNLKEDPLK